MVLEEEKDDGNGDGSRKEHANPGDEKHQRVHVRCEVGRLFRIDWQLRLHGLVSSSFQATGKWLAQIPCRQCFTAAGNQDCSDNAENRKDPAETDNLENRSAVSGGRGVIVIAKKQNMIYGSADLSRGGIHEPEAHVAAGILDA